MQNALFLFYVSKKKGHTLKTHLKMNKNIRVCIEIIFVFSKSQINILLLLYSNKKNNNYNLFLDKGCHKQYKYCAFISNQPNTFTLQHTPHDQHGQGVFQSKGDTVFFLYKVYCAARGQCCQCTPLF